MSTSELDSRNIAISMRKSVENLVISSQDAIGQSISQALTFSGVIAQHSNQILQENRSVSRSPSPSLRNSEGADSLENDKGSEMTIHVPSHPAGDAISVSSASDVACSITPVPGKSDNPKGTSSNQKGTETVARSKKKSWYTSLYPTYKNKSDDFKRLFKDLPEDERLIVDYSCALQKDILAHGRLYASQNYLCFYASIFGWETSMSLRWKDVTAITKEKTALVIPNAILVCTEGEKNFLTSFSGRDKAYLMLFRIWQNALMDQPMSSQEIWQWVHSCYGEELGFNSDDECYGQNLPVEVSIIPPDIINEDLADSSMEAGGSEPREESRSTRSASRSRDESPPLVTNGEEVSARYRGGGEEGEADTLPTDMSDSSDSEDKHNSDAEKCTCPHTGRLLLHQQFPFNIDQLFTMIFTNSKFNLEMLATRGTRDYVQAPWQPAAGLKCRQVSYVLGLTSGPIGPKEVHITETQIMNKCSKPGMLYSIDCTSDNSGIPYADYFSVETHYCLQRISEHVTDLFFYATIKYKKNMWPMVKTFLEKNTISGLEDYSRLLEARLLVEAESAAPAARKGRRHRRHTSSSQQTAAAACVRPARAAAALLCPRTPAPRPAAARSWLAALLLLVLLLLAANALLLYRLYHPPHGSIDDLHDRMSSMSAEGGGEWAALLERHTKRQRGELLAWRDALDTTVTHLHQTEKALRNLLETIEPSLMKAQEETNEALEKQSESDTPRHTQEL